jgi:hypothetical protein
MKKLVYSLFLEKKHNPQQSAGHIANILLKNYKDIYIHTHTCMLFENRDIKWLVLSKYMD